MIKFFDIVKIKIRVVNHKLFNVINFILNSNKFWLCIFILYFFIYGGFWVRYGFDTDDGGFILALSKRIIDGELPYKDFIYIRPPLTIYIHALSFLFGDYTFYADRLLTITLRW